MGQDGSLRVMGRPADRDVFITDNLQSYSISPHGLLFGTPAGHAKIVDVATGKDGNLYIPTLKPDPQKPSGGSPVSVAAESPDGRWMVAGNVDGYVLAFSTASDSAGGPHRFYSKGVMGPCWLQPRRHWPSTDNFGGFQESNNFRAANLVHVRPEGVAGFSGRRLSTGWG